MPHKSNGSRGNRSNGRGSVNPTIYATLSSLTIGQNVREVILLGGIFVRNNRWAGFKDDNAAFYNNVGGVIYIPLNQIVAIAE